MKKITNLLMLLAMALFASCDNPIEIPETLEVKPYNIEGTWQLSTIDGKALADSTYVYLVLDRKYGFKIYQNTNSMYPVLYTGTYELEYDWRNGDIISGVYDYEQGAWRNEYIVSDLYEESMIWTSLVDTAKIGATPEVQKFLRVHKEVDMVPDYIVGAVRKPLE